MPFCVTFKLMIFYKTVEAQHGLIYPDMHTQIHSHAGSCCYAGKTDRTNGKIFKIVFVCMWGGHAALFWWTYGSQRTTRRSQSQLSPSAIWCWGQNSGRQAYLQALLPVKAILPAPEDFVKFCSVSPLTLVLFKQQFTCRMVIERKHNKDPVVNICFCRNQWVSLDNISETALPGWAVWCTHSGSRG